MILRLYRIYKTGKSLYIKVLKPVYLDLRKDAYESDTDKKSISSKKKKRRKNVVHKKP